MVQIPGRLLLWRWQPLLLPSPFISLSFRSIRACSSSQSASGETSLTARERRQLRQESRGTRAGSSNWREEVEERLIKKPKKNHKVSWRDELNLDNLARLGPQWWIVRVAGASAPDTIDRLVRSLARNFPNIDFKVYYPTVREKRRLKDGSYSTKSKPIFPGCVFLHCILNKEMHDFVREFDGVGGFIGSKVGNIIRQINKPKPVSADEMEAIFRQAREEQELADKAFDEMQKQHNFNLVKDLAENSNNSTNSKAPRPLRKDAKVSKSSLSVEEGNKFLAPGVRIRVISGPFAEFTGCLEKLDHKTGKATVGITLFGKQSHVDLQADQIAVQNA